MARWCIGIDLGGTAIKFGLLSADRRRRGALELPTPGDQGADAVIEQMIDGARRLMADEGLSREEVVGVGIGSPGPLSPSKGIIYATPNVTGMRNIPMRDRVAEGLGLPATLENDANAAAYGEYLCGAGEGAGSMVLLTLGTGLGSGIITDGAILHGAHEIGGELGHLIVEPDGEQCGCGQKGCLERYCSARYLAEYGMRKIRREKSGGSLAALLEQNGSIDAKDIHGAFRAGDPVAEEIWQRGAYFLALGCVSICRIFDPDRIVLAGGMTKAGDDLMGPVRSHFGRMHWSLTEPQTEIVLSQLGNDAGFIGAAGVAWRAFGQG